MSGQAGKCRSAINKEMPGVMYAKRPINIYKAPKRTHAAAETTGQRRNQRKQEKAVAGSVEEMAELRQHAAEQAALFNLGADEADTEEESVSGDHVGE